MKTSWHLAVALLVPACSGSTTTATSASPSPSGVSGIGWQPCDPNPELDCANVPVPVDWSDPGGEKLTLAVIRHEAGNPDQRIGTILINPGHGIWRPGHRSC